MIPGKLILIFQVKKIQVKFIFKTMAVFDHTGFRDRVSRTGLKSQKRGPAALVGNLFFSGIHEFILCFTLFRKDTNSETPFIGLHWL